MRTVSERILGKMRPQSSLKKLRSLVLGMGALLLAFSVQGQSRQAVSSEVNTSVEASKPGFARIAWNKRVVLDGSRGIQSAYEANMRHLGYQTKAEAEAFFSSFGDQTVTFTVVDAWTLRIEPNTQAPGASTWSVADWNTHFQQKAAALPTSSK